MSILKPTIIALGVIASSFVVTKVANAQEYTLRFQHFVSPKSGVPAFYITPWAKRIMKASAGRLKIEIYPSMQLGGKPQAMFDQIKDGVIDGGWFIPSYTPGRFPEFEAFELPFITSTSASQSSRAVWEYTQKHMPKQLKLVRPISIHVHGPGVIHKKGSPVRKVEDMKGLKLRGPSRQANKLLSKMGAIPIGIPAPTFPEALSKGVVDGGVIPWEIVVPLKIHELADSHTEIGGKKDLYNTVFVWAMNKASYDKLPADLQKILDDNTGINESELAGKAFEKGDIRSIKIVNKTDNTVVTLSDEERARWKKISTSVITDWIADMDSKGLPGAKMVQDARDLVAKHSK